MRLPASVRVVEVGPRDGLQNEPTSVSVDDKIALVRRLVDAGLSSVEVGAFVSPKWVPQMAGSAEVLQQVEPRPGVTYSVLVPNLQGFHAALAAGAKEVAVFASASETFSRRNINCSIAESLERFAPVIALARERSVRVRGYVSCVLGCPYEGEVSPTKVVEVATALHGLGCDEVSLGDTIGVGTPGKAQALVKAAAESIPRQQIAIHFHDTYGQALANILACLEAGIATVDASIAGLGGCPYAAASSGNVATEDVLYMLEGLGIATGVDLARAAAVGDWISKRLNRPNASRAGQTISGLDHSKAPALAAQHGPGSR
jgi:hydroxymethylglutaryl-CoA lyase